MKTYLLGLIGGGLIVSSLLVGVVHGRLTNRWGIQPDMAEAGRRLKSVPADFGDWRMSSESKLEDRIAEMLQCEGSLTRVYENTRTGQKVSVFLIVGPSGPVAVHTPEICYSSKDYRITDDRVKYTFDDQQDLWDLRLKANQAGAPPIRVMYAWTNDGNWDATANPRFAFGGRPLLYKIQLAGPIPSESGETDACRDFLAGFLPALRPHLYQAGKSG